jgi:hypothetical protein
LKFKRKRNEEVLSIRYNNRNRLQRNQFAIDRNRLQRNQFAIDVITYRVITYRVITYRVITYRVIHITKHI